jgi:hypothetical protein
MSSTADGIAFFVGLGLSAAPWTPPMITSICVCVTTTGPVRESLCRAQSHVTQPVLVFVSLLSARPHGPAPDQPAPNLPARDKPCPIPGSSGTMTQILRRHAWLCHPQRHGHAISAGAGPAPQGHQVPGPLCSPSKIRKLICTEVLTRVRYRVSISASRLRSRSASTGRRAPAAPRTWLTRALRRRRLPALLPRHKPTLRPGNTRSRCGPSSPPGALARAARRCHSATGPNPVAHPTRRRFDATHRGVLL